MRFLFVSRFALIHALALQVKKEGHDVRYAILSKPDRIVGDGFVEKVENWEEHKDWAEIIVFDDSDFGDICERLRKEGKAVIGGTRYSDKLEFDRDFATEEMKGAGLTTLPSWEFEGFDAAIEFVKANPNRY